MLLTHSVAPISLAKANFPSFMSTPTMYLQPATLAAWMTERPRAPRPKTASEVPGSTLVVLNTAPHPVETPQPSRHILSRSAPRLILAAEISAMTAYSAKVLQPMK